MGKDSGSLTKKLKAIMPSSKMETPKKEAPPLPKKGAHGKGSSAADRQPEGSPPPYTTRAPGTMRGESSRQIARTGAYGFDDDDDGPYSDDDEGKCSRHRFTY